MKMKQAIYSIAAIMVAAFIGIQAAQADVTVVYKMTSRDGSGTQTIKYLDKQHVRIDITDATHNGTTMMKLGDKVYMIQGKVVQDMDQLAEMMTMMMGKGLRKKSTGPPIKYEDTGRTETIAGIRGKVYRFVENGKQHEVVMGKNKKLQDAVLGVVEITKAATGMMPSDPSNRIQQDASIKSMALLRMDDRVRLQSINTRAVPAATFKLPSKPQQMGGPGGLLNGFLGW